MKKHPPGVIIDQSALKFLKRIIKTRKAGRSPSTHTTSDQPWVASMFDDSEYATRFGLIVAGQYEINKEILTPNYRISGARNLKGNKPMPKVTVFALTSTEPETKNLKLEIAFRTEGKYLTFYYMQ